MYANPPTPADVLKAESLIIGAQGGTVVESTDLGTHAIEYGVRGWEVFPLRGKVPAIRGGRGVLDATTDTTTIAAWWGGRYAGCNIGVRPPETVFVLDIDPQHGGHLTIEALEAEHGALPETLTTWTGRGDGSRHLYFRRPAGKLTSTRLSGVDIKDHSGYLVAAPSIHPDTGKPYIRVDAPVALPPPWLVALIGPASAPLLPRSPRRLFPIHTGPSIADEFTTRASWSDILGPHGWRCLDADPDADGTRWLHPNATSASSATVRHGLLFVYSPNTPFGITESQHPNGYTKFRAFAVLDHQGDMKAAARRLRANERP